MTEVESTRLDQDEISSPEDVNENLPTCYVCLTNSDLIRPCINEHCSARMCEPCLGKFCDKANLTDLCCELCQKKLAIKERKYFDYSAFCGTWVYVTISLFVNLTFPVIIFFLTSGNTI